MEKEFLNYKQSLALKELGFEEGCIDYYFKVYKENVIQLWKRANKLPDVSFPIVNAPLYQQAFRFFREKYGLVALIDIGVHEFSYKIFKNESSITPLKDYLDYNGTYEEAEEACINKLIEIAKEVNND